MQRRKTVSGKVTKKDGVGRGRVKSPDRLPLLTEEIQKGSKVRVGTIGRSVTQIVLKSQGVSGVLFRGRGVPPTLDGVGWT